MRKSIEKCVGGFFILLKMMSSLVTARVYMIDLSLTKAVCGTALAPGFGHPGIKHYFHRDLPGSKFLPGGFKILGLIFSLWEDGALRISPAVEETHLLN